MARPFHWVLAPFANTNPLVPLALVALLASILLLFAFRWLSNQRKLEEIKAKIHAHFLELKLFRHDVSVIWSAEKQIFRYNLLYIAYLLKPLIVTLPIFALFLVVLDGWFSSRPLKIGEPAVVSVSVRPQADRALDSLELEDPKGMRVETPALRIPDENRADWRIRPVAAGQFELRFRTGGSATEGASKRVRVGRERLAYVGRSLSGIAWFSGFENCEESPLSSSSPITRIEVSYPSAVLTVFGWRVNWVLAFVVLSIVFAFLLKKPFGIVL